MVLLQAKPWWKSKTIIGHVLALALYFAGKADTPVPELPAQTVLILDALYGIVIRFFTRQPVTAPVTGALKEV